MSGWPTRRVRDDRSPSRIPGPMVLVLLVVLAVGCTGSAPEILFPDTQLFLSRDPESGTVAERLRLFVAVRDPDGADDPSRLFLVHDDSGLFWELSVEQWVQVEYGGDQWYGAPDIAMPDGESLPRGEYRLIVEDRSLSRSETSFFITAEPRTADAGFPSLLVEQGGLRVTGDREAVLRVYNRSGQMIVNRAMMPGNVPDAVLRQIPDEAGVEAFVATLDEDVRLESGPFIIPADTIPR